jgi:ABC-type oligopeptide transport system ATPase subunit
MKQSLNAITLKFTQLFAQPQQKLTESTTQALLKLYKKSTYKDQSNTTYFIMYSKRRHVSTFTKPSSGLPLIC